VSTPVPTRTDIGDAAARIAGHVRRTPVLELLDGVGESAAQITLKLDLLQPTGSFKVRGAFSRLLAATPRPERVVAASGGNFGLAVAHAAGELDVDADIFVPESSPTAKVERLRRQGASVHVIPGHYADAHIVLIPSGYYSDETTAANGDQDRVRLWDLGGHLHCAGPLTGDNVQLVSSLE